MDSKAPFPGFFSVRSSPASATSSSSSSSFPSARTSLLSPAGSESMRRF